jgi:hypothetical protein
LWHVAVRRDGVWLQPKSGGEARRIPQIATDHFALAERHRSLSCAACHATWAPQCYGCHLDFDPTQEQWDHLERRATPGQWRERRWAVHNGLPTLGVDRQGRVRPVVPGMIMTVEHPDLPSALFVRRFAAIAPHTTGKSRRCNDCHGAAPALGLGEGTLRREGETWRFTPSWATLKDGLAADAWTSLTADNRATEGHEMRPFSEEELQRLLPPVGQGSCGMSKH